MKQKIFALCFLMPIFFFVKSQTIHARNNSTKPKMFVALLYNGKTWSHGYLSGIDDSSVQVGAKRVEFTNSLIENPSYKRYNYSYIERLNIRKYGSTGRGIGLGVLIGAGSGALIGLATYQRTPQAYFDFGPGFNAVGGAIIGLIPGAILGAIIGSHKKKFLINRNKQNFDSMKLEILNMYSSNYRFL